MSIDSIFVHKMWNEYELSNMVNGGVPFAMLLDADGRVGKVYGVYDEDAGVETRGWNGSHAFRLETGQDDVQTRAGSGRQCLERMED